MSGAKFSGKKSACYAFAWDSSNGGKRMTIECCPQMSLIQKARYKENPILIANNHKTLGYFISPHHPENK
jgi:hypothetical protein